MMAAVWEAHFGEMCTGVNWERFLCLSHAQVMSNPFLTCRNAFYFESRIYDSYTSLYKKFCSLFKILYETFGIEHKIVALNLFLVCPVNEQNV